MKRVIYLVAAFALSYSTYAQKNWKAKIRPVETSAYHNIEIDQRLVGVANNNFSDLRILTYGAEQTPSEVPYFVRSVSPVQHERELEAYTLKTNSVKDSLNIIVVDNSAKEKIDRFYIVYQNADAKIDVGIRGSNDLKQWYVVKKKSNVSNYPSTQETDASLLIDFPKGDYSYYEITLSNDQQSPLDVKLVGNMRSSSIYGQFTALNIGKLAQVEDENNHTLISFPELKDTFLISKIEIEIDNKTVYMRNAKLQNSKSSGYDSFILSSKEENTFYLNDFKMNSGTVIVIDNQDNPALKVTAVRVYGLKRFICAHLDNDKPYTISIDKKYSYPSYDIEKFKDELAVNLMETSVDPSSIEVTEEELVVREPMFLEKPVVLWSIIIGIGLFLTFICVKMIKKMK